MRAAPSSVVGREHNALTWPISVTESGMVTLVRLVQSEKACCESRSDPGQGHGAGERDRYTRAAPSSVVGRECYELTWAISVTESGMVILVRFVHRKKANCASRSDPGQGQGTSE